MRKLLLKVVQINKLKRMMAKIKMKRRPAKKRRKPTKTQAKMPKLMPRLQDWQQDKP